MMEVMYFLLHYFYLISLVTLQIQNENIKQSTNQLQCIIMDKD